MKNFLNSKKVKFLVVVAILVSGYFLFLRPKRGQLDMRNFDLEEVMFGDLSKTITASGSINPVNVVNVGTQVSGIVEKIYVDYNDEVKSGQILAELDMSILDRALAESGSRVRKAKANLDLVKLNTERTRTLFKSNYIAKIELDQAETELKTAQEEYNIALSQNKTAEINLGYATITSPVNGVVISREIDVGQTVAASFSAPVLFQIAEDLTKMQIETSISESDIGFVKHGMKVSFTIDSFPNKTFYGIVRQIRLNPNTDQNVVVYNVIVEIDNEDQLILPGMTAYVSIPVGEVKDVLYVKTIAFRFNPSEEALQAMKLSERPERKSGFAVLYKLDENDRVHPIYVKRGFSSMTETEIITEELKKGDRIVSNSVLIGNKKR